MSRLLILLLIIVVLAIIWYFWRENQRAAQRRQAEEARALRAAAERASLAAAEPAPRVAAGAAATAAAAAAEGAGTGSGSGLLQEAADVAAGLRYEQAADRMEAMTSDLAEARQQADLAADQRSRQTDEALAALQIVADAHGGAAPGDGTHECPGGYPIKGNISSMLYHEPGQGLYARTIPEVCFQTAAAAEAAGFAPVSGGARDDDAIVIERVEVIAVDETGDWSDESAAAVAPAGLLLDVRNGDDDADIVAAAIAAADAGGVPPGAVRGDGGRDCPGAYPIKGNQQSMLFHEPGTASYQVTIPEFCFSSAAAARAAGFAPTRH